MAEATCNRVGEEEWGKERERTRKGGGGWQAVIADCRLCTLNCLVYSNKIL